ncbi:hypothetical protein RB195_013799 [Necator americanus]|uniref:Uncharacterized protein n=2 Tax=Necator americanus TaxID=51031 RepID=A0ABR1DXM4_NECAM|nr:hypothetical protein NECAME_08385 [Necator americanus]ETN81640.1 hypothetical protein NECAME_08385 [Necator americanus]
MCGGQSCFMRSLPVLYDVLLEQTGSVQVGVHQGSSLSPLLFILCVDTITKEIQKQHPWTLLFADDVMLPSESRDVLQKQVQSWKDRLQQYGLRLNIKN